MLTRYTKLAIEAYIKSLYAEGADKAAVRLEKLICFDAERPGGSIFFGYQTRQINKYLIWLNDWELQPAAGRQNASLGETAAQPLAAAIRSLRNLEDFLRSNSANGRYGDLVKFRKVLAKHESATIEQFVNAVLVLRRRKPRRPDMHHKALADKLKMALGDDAQFDPLFEELSKLDPRGVAKVTECLMSGGSSNSRKWDLKRIQERHESSRKDRAGRRATEGRSAA